MFELFPREQVLVLQFERCVQDPVGEMHRTWRFLGVEPPAKTPERLLKHRQAGSGTPELEPDVSEELAKRYREDSARLAELCPEIDLSLWTSVAGEGRTRATPRSTPRSRDRRRRVSLAGGGAGPKRAQVVAQPGVLDQVVAGPAR